MRESELHDFLQAHAGTQACLAYRVDARGYLQLRPEPRFASVGVGMLALLLAACAGHLGEAEAPGSGCRDAAGYEVACPTWPESAMHSVPDELGPLAGQEVEVGEGCPVRPTADAAGDAELAELAPGDDASSQVSANEHDALDDARGDANPEAPGTTDGVRVNFSVDPNHGSMRGMVVVGMSPLDARTGRLRFVPTTEILDDLERRRAERRAARKRNGS